MTAHSTPRRARNSLSRAKFLVRMNNGLATYVAHVVGGDISCFDAGTIEDHYFDNGTHGEFIIDSHGVTKHSLKDINVIRNNYNQNFAFRTKKAALKYLITNRMIDLNVRKLVS